MIPAPDEDAPEMQGLGFVVLGPGEPRLVGAIVTLTDDDATLMLAPLRPLPPRSHVAAYVTRSLTEAAGGCLEPSTSTAEGLAAPSADWAEAIATNDVSQTVKSASSVQLGAAAKS